jgi:hypothetical protein
MNFVSLDIIDDIVLHIISEKIKMRTDWGVPGVYLYSRSNNQTEIVASEILRIIRIMRRWKSLVKK